MNIDTRTETLLYAVQEKLGKLPRVNLCQDYPPEKEYYCHVQIVDGQRGITFVKPNSERMFIPESMYTQFRGFILSDSQKSKLLFTTEDIKLSFDTADWTPNDAITLGDLAQFLQDYQPKQP